MATVTVTFAAGAYAGAQLRQLSKAIQKVASNMPDQVGSGASTVLTVDNAPSSGTVSVQITAGPYSGNAIIV
jgi:hypothetical protein